MKKILSVLCAAVLVLSLFGAAAFADEGAGAAALTDWAYAGITLNSEDFGIGSVYYAAEYFGREGILNPLTVAPYTDEELAAITESAVEGAEGYVDGVPAGALVGLSTYEGGRIYWFDADNAAKILASADPLVLNAGTGEVCDLEGEAVAAPLAALETWAYAGITLNSEDFGIGSVYYAAEYFTREGILNPMTVAPYTDEELAAITDGAVVGAKGYVSGLPAEAVIGLGVNGSEQIFWYDDANAANILSSADPLVLNAETGEVCDLAGEAVAAAIA